MSACGEYGTAVHCRSSTAVLHFSNEESVSYAVVMGKNSNDNGVDRTFGFGQRLRAARQKANLSQTEMGKSAGEHGRDAGKQSISDWEAERYYPKVDQLRVMCLRIKASADDLIFGDIKEAAALATAEHALAQLSPALQQKLLDRMTASTKSETASTSAKKSAVRRDVAKALKKNKNAPETKEITDPTFASDAGKPDFLPK